MRGRFVVAALAATVLLAGCGDDADGAGGNGQAPAELTVVDAGAEPREALRVGGAVGDTGTWTMTMDMAMATEVDGQAMPTQTIPSMEMDLDVVTEEVTDDRVRFAYLYSDVRTDGSLSALDDLLDTVVGLSGTVTTTRNGTFVDGSVTPPEGLAAEMASVVDQLEQQLAALTVPMPTEPVGVGAVWEVTTEVELAGVDTTMTATYTLVELDAGRYVLDVEISQEFAPTTVTENGATIEIISGTSTGSGRTEGTLDQMLPTRATSSVAGELSMTVTRGEQSQDVVQRTDMTMVLERR
jgi:hypothetical protein